MVITQIIGGLGNQMFQYAAGLSLAKKLGTELKLDIEEFSHYSLRTYSLKHYAISATIASPAEVARFQKKGLAWIVYLVLRKLRLVEKRKMKGYFEDMSLNYNNELMNQKGEVVYLRGYWQSEDYFSHIAEDIKKEFTVSTPPTGKNSDALKNIKKMNSVSLHIRRGDYVTDAHTNSVHGSTSLDYYHQALAYIKERVDSPEVFVFSDDIPWVKENLVLDVPMHFMDHNGPEEDYEDMRLMRHCKHHIIANSSFSWWGAWLAESKGQIVIAPTKWFNDGRTEQIVPKRWHRI